jgi:ABC-2 type transport system ATP-binding protein
VLVSSHLISEMAYTADALIVIGRGRLLAQTTVAQLSAHGATLKPGGSLEEAFFQLTEGVTDYSGGLS